MVIRNRVIWLLPAGLVTGSSSAFIGAAFCIDQATCPLREACRAVWVGARIASWSAAAVLQATSEESVHTTDSGITAISRANVTVVTANRIIETRAARTTVGRAFVGVVTARVSSAAACNLVNNQPIAAVGLEDVEISADVFQPHPPSAIIHIISWLGLYLVVKCPSHETCAVKIESLETQLVPSYVQAVRVDVETDLQIMRRVDRHIRAQHQSIYSGRVGWVAEFPHLDWLATVSVQELILDENQTTVL